MEQKKNSNKNLENYRGIFFMLGLALSLGAAIEIIELKSTYQLPELPQIEEKATTTITIPITYPKMPEKPQPKLEEPEPLKMADPKKIFKIVNNTQTTLDPSGMLDFPLDSIIFEPDPEVDVPVDAVNVENMARPQSCEELRGKEEQMRCFNQWIGNYIAQEIEFPSGIFNRTEKIFVEFVISKTGQVEDVKIIRGENPEYRKEALRVIEGLPELVPASQFGRKVPVRVRIPVNFRVD